MSFVALSLSWSISRAPAGGLNAKSVLVNLAACLRVPKLDGGTGARRGFPWTR